MSIINITEGAEFTGETGKVYLAVSSLGQDNVWTAVEKTNPTNIVVLKSPSADDINTGWPRFQHEMVMHELFKTSDWIRKQVDRIAPSNDSSAPPILVLEITETTLWSARSKRPLTKGEIRAVAYAVLHALQDVHAKGLVYADLKMQNIMLSGFDVNNPGDGSGLVVKLGDLGIVMSPSMGKVQPVVYRAPEVQLKYQITEAADIWGFALIYCHLLEAQTRFSKTGLYDDLYTTHGTMPEREQAVKGAVTNDYDLHEVKYYRDCVLPCNDPDHHAGEHWDELKRRGLDVEDIDFLKWVLRADPTQRPTASAVLRSSWFAGGRSSAMISDSQQNLDSSAPVNTHTAAEFSGTALAPSEMAEDGRDQVKRQKKSDQSLAKSSHDVVADSAAPFLPWLSKPGSTANGSVEVSSVAGTTGASHQTHEHKTTSTAQAAQSDGTLPDLPAETNTSAPFLPWLHSSSETKSSTPASNGDDLADASDVNPHGTNAPLKDHPLVIDALRNQDDHKDTTSSGNSTTTTSIVGQQVEAKDVKETSKPGHPTVAGPTSTAAGGMYLSYGPR